MKVDPTGALRRASAWWLVAGLIVAIAAPAGAGEPAASPGEDAICAGLSGRDEYWCRYSCQWPGPMEEQTGQCLLVLRFGAVGVETYLAVQKGGGDVEQAALARGMAPEEARRLMLFLDADAYGMVIHTWVRERGLSAKEQTELGEAKEAHQEALRLSEAERYSEALELAHRALEVLERVLGSEHRHTLTAGRNLAILLSKTGDYAGAESLYRSALEGFERALDPEHPDTLKVVNNLAFLLQSRGNYTGAEPLYRRAVEGFARVVGPEHPYTLKSVKSLGSLLESMGDYTGAESLYWRSLKGFERVLGPEHPDTLSSVNALAVVRTLTGDLVGAEPLYRRAVEGFGRVLGQDHSDTLSILNNLAGFLSLKGDYLGAEPLYRRVFEGYEGVFGPEHPLTLKSLTNLAGLLSRSGDFAGAEPLYRRVLEVRERVLGPEHPDTLTSVNNLAALEWDLGRIPVAKKLLREGVRGVRNHFQRNVDAARDDTRLRRFLDSIRGTFHTFLSLFSSPGDEQLVFEQALFWQGAATATTMMINDLQRAERNAPAEQKALFVRYREAARERMRLLMAPVQDDAALAERARGLQVLADELARLEQELSLVNADFRRRRVLVEATPEGVCESLKAADASMVVYVRYGRFLPKARNDSSPSKDERSSPQYLGLAVRPKDCSVGRVELGDAERIEPLVQVYQDAVAEMESCVRSNRPHPDAVGHFCERELAAVDAAAVVVREKVWDPVASSLPESGRIYVVPDGSLVDVSFGSLPVGIRPDWKVSYLIEDRDLAYLPSPRDAMRLGQALEKGGEGALVMGWVDYTAAQGMPLALLESEVCGGRGCASVGGRKTRVAKAEASQQKALRSTDECGWATETWTAGIGQEASEVAEALGRSLSGGALLTTNWRATEGLLRQEMPGKRILHMSSHGFYSTWDACRQQDEGRRRLLRMAPKRMEAVGEEQWTPDPLTLTGLVLAGANAAAEGTDREDPSNDGVLSGREIADLDLTSAEVVVLSACETGRGDRTSGEGSLGLGKAFLVAGARQVVMALWQVTDAYTENLFREFYQGVTQGPAVAEAGKSVAAAEPSASPSLAPVDPVAALRKAQIEILNDARDRLGLTHSSYLWGAFVPMVRGN